MDVSRTSHVLSTSLFEGRSWEVSVVFGHVEFVWFDGSLEDFLACALSGHLRNRWRRRKWEQEAVMKEPGNFPLERLLAIFQCIASVGDFSFGEEEDEEGEEEATGYDKESNNMMSDILLQVASLCDANFIIKSGSCPLEGSIRYRSMVSEDMSLKVARSLSFPLSKYLYRR
ncbi:hypothetical protein YC2023_077783 [Brassica napus]